MGQAQGITEWMRCLDAWKARKAAWVETARAASLDSLMSAPVSRSTESPRVTVLWSKPAHALAMAAG